MIRPLLIALAALATWHGAPSGAFHYDDLHSVSQNVHIRSLAEPWRFFTSREPFSIDHDKTMYRPLVVLSLAVDYALGGDNPRIYLLTNALIHAGAAVAVWWLAVGLGAAPAGALVAGLLFAVHPVCAEPINYVSARSDSMAAALGLLGVGMWVRK